MTRKSDFEKIGYLEISPLYIVISGMFFALLVISMDIFPYRSDWYLLVSVPVGLFGFLNFIWVFRKPNIYAKFYFQTSLSVMFALIAYRYFDYLLPQFSFVIQTLLLFSFLFAHTLPMWDSSTAAIIRNELMHPKTKMGKNFFRLSMAFASIALPLALVLGKFPKSQVTAFIMGLTCLLMSIVFPFGKAPSSPWESRSFIVDRQNNKKQGAPEDFPLSKQAPSRRISSSKKKLNGK